MNFQNSVATIWLKGGRDAISALRQLSTLITLPYCGFNPDLNFKFEFKEKVKYPPPSQLPPFEEKLHWSFQIRRKKP
jgi:hypothetical protein